MRNTTVEQTISRRSILHAGIAGLGASLLRPIPIDGAAPPRSGGFRFVHLTDTHVQPERRAGKGWEAALRSLAKLDPAPSQLITGGDHVMDAFAQDPARCKLQWDLYCGILKDNTNLPVYPVMGNHDVCGWGKPEKFAETLAGYGKTMALERFGIKQSNQSFDAGGWHFVLLDSVMKRDKSYLGDFGDEQRAWLEADLEKIDASTPVIAVSHIPILTVTGFFGDNVLRDKTWSVPDSEMHRDMNSALEILRTRNTRVVLSGHMHLLDRCDYQGQSFICGGAVSGNWWKGTYMGCPEGYCVFDLWPDGTFECQYVTYGWVAEKE